MEIAKNSELNLSQFHQNPPWQIEHGFFKCAFEKNFWKFLQRKNYVQHLNFLALVLRRNPDWHPDTGLALHCPAVCLQMDMSTFCHHANGQKVSRIHRWSRVFGWTLWRQRQEGNEHTVLENRTHSLRLWAVLLGVDLFPNLHLTQIGIFASKSIVLNQECTCIFKMLQKCVHPIHWQTRNPTMLTTAPRVK